MSIFFRGSATDLKKSAVYTVLLIISTLPLGKPKHREVKELAQSTLQVSHREKI